LIAVKTVALVGAIGQSTIATLLGAGVCVIFGWNWSAGLVYGAALSVASTVVLTRVLADNDHLQSPTGRIAIGWLVMEDILTVFVLVLLPVVFAAAEAGTNSNLLIAFGSAALKLIAFVVFTLVVGARLIPWMLGKIAATHSRELFTLSVLAIALGIASASTYFFGVSMALGAFLAGMVVGQSDFSARAGAEALPMRDAFAVMFFLSVGMLLDPQQIASGPLLTLATLGVVMVGKPLAALAIVAALGYSSRIGLGVAVALAQIGEFSFLVGVLGRDLGVLPDTAMNALVAAAIVSIMLNPIMYRSLPAMERFLARYRWMWRLLNRKLERLTSVPEGETAQLAHRAVVVGYGPVGRNVARLLGERGVEPTIVEMNLQTFRTLRQSGMAVVYGDATQRDVLIQAGAANAVSLIFSASLGVDITEAIRTARELNPDIHIVVRADYIGQSESLLQAGADEVFSGEGEVVLALTGSILTRLGATPEQLDEERARIRAEASRKQQPPVKEVREGT
jgi:CPA2 family monovalent cation:H+ antiporter-2